MKKYLHIYKTTLIESLTYIWNLLFSFINFSVMIFIFINLWEYVYSDSSKIINGYNLKQMIWYVLITEIMWFGTRNKILTKEISNDIRNGNIAYNINKPYNYVIYIMAKHFGEITVKSVIFWIIGTIVGIAFIGPIPTFNIATIPIVILIVILATIINSTIRISISTLSFWIEDSTPFHWVYDKAVLLLGTLFPVEMFPGILGTIIKYTPIFVVSYGPAKLIIDFSIETFFKVLLAQIIYLILTSVIISILYKKGVKKLNVNGG